MKVTPNEAIDHIKDCLRSGLVPMLSGSPGVGKSDIIHSVFESFNLKVIDIRLSQLDCTELSGFPAIKNNRASHIPMDIFPLKGDALPEEHNGWGLLFDEFNSAPVSVAAAAYKIILDRHIGQFPLHERVRMICAGNLATDGAIVNRMSTAMQSRLVHLELRIDAEQWIQWANANNLDHRVIAYIQSVPDNLHKFDPNHDDKTFASPRTWQFTSRLMENHTGSLLPKLPLIAGTIGEPIAREFVLFNDIYTDLPAIQDIMKDPENIKYDQEPGILYALSNMVAAYAKPGNIKELMKFITRMPVEFATITLQNLLHRNPNMATNLEVTKWIEIYAPNLF